MTLATQDVRWGVGGLPLVDGVTLAVEPGRTLGLIGPNGSGKSSLLRLMARLRRVSSGVITLEDRDIASLSRRTFARRVAFVEQQATTDAALTVQDVVRLGRTPHRGALSPWNAADAAAVDTALAQVGMADRRDRLWHSLSGGERQRALIARALAQCPSELLLDEPTNHLDIRHQLEILALVQRLPVTSVVALHDLNLAALFCDRLAALHQGRLVCVGTPEEVLTPEVIFHVFGVRASVERSPRDGRLQVHFLLG
ncbi:ABC transporter ATP-binding protein [Azospirillum griseum]|uniref:ABC transporter ATP-binding protein n=1 Tax=Azospirillum griseum TaxID=2496639 RepID=A0A3S0K3I8_9PROT|nr:ABC transporter ATP-binding protein [Azospirillum griseum]RTR18137.1 ABC transporter ATP-binding protein [Azospirillum griseum]